MQQDSAEEENAVKQVLFVCVGNSGRSQMAEAFFNEIAPAGFCALSAGTAPAERVNPTVVKVMEEAGFDLSGRSPKRLTVDMVESAARVVTLGCAGTWQCPKGLPAEDWGIEDPADQPVEKVRRIRERIRGRVEDLARSLTCEEARARAPAGPRPD